MPWAAAAVVAGAIITSESQKSAANKAAKAQTNAANAANAQLEQNYQRTANNLNPYISAGNSAIGTIGALNSGHFASFQADPGYQFSFDQQLKGLDRSAAAHGSLYSGGHSADILSMANGLASQEYGNYWNRLMQTANMGEGAASNLGSVGTGNAAGISNNLMNAGVAQANGYINNANAQSNMYGQVANAFGNWYGQQSTPTSSSYNLGGNGASTYQDINNGQFNNNGTFNFATSGNGSAQRTG